MKTKAVPSMVMLAAAGIRCVAGIVNEEETTSFLVSLLVTMCIFYLIGYIVKIVLDRNFKDMVEDLPSEEEIIDGEDVENFEESQESEEDFVKEKPLEEPQDETDFED